VKSEAAKVMLISSCFGECHGRDAIHYVFEKEKKKNRSIERFFYFLDSSKGLEIKV